MFKTLIEDRLIKLGYSKIKWYRGRLGYYVLAVRYNATECINIGDLVNETLQLEEKGWI